MQRPHKTTLDWSKGSITVSFPEENEPIDVFGRTASVYDGPDRFSYLFADFGKIFESTSLNRHVPRLKRLDGFNRSESAQLLSSASEEMRELFAGISEISNKTQKLSTTEARRLLDSFRRIYSVLDEEFHWVNSDAFIVPLKGGGIIAKLFELSTDKVLQIEAKRLPMSDYDGHFCFGMHISKDFGHDVKDNVTADAFVSGLNNKNVTLLEVCVATGMTTCAFLIDLHSKNVKPRSITVLASAISQQGFEVAKQLANFLGFSEIRFVCGKIAYSLADYISIGKDSLTDDDGKFIVSSPWEAYQLLGEEIK